MQSEDDRRWNMIQSALEAEAAGKTPRYFASRRTLFGIPSTLDTELAALQNTSDSQAKDFAESPAQDSHHLVKHPLKPVFNERSRVLLLGTMPSPKSRETGFYYNHPQNRFWKVISTLFEEKLPETNDQKRALVLKHKIALWDVLASCTIEGAKDVSIANCVPNNIGLITGKAQIKAIFCTGAKAAELYARYCESVTGISAIRLPSTSPANAAFSLDDLIDAYRVILSYL